MIESASEVRNSIVDFLKQEIVGPAPGHPFVQLNREEVLRNQDSPRQRYSTGVLFPLKAEQGVQLVPDGQVESEAEVPEGDAPEGGTVVGAEAARERLETPPDTDVELNLANEFLPSAMGASALVALGANVGPGLIISVEFGTYRHEELKGRKVKDRKGNEVDQKAWWRTQHSYEIPLRRESLLLPGVVSFSEPILREDGKTVLDLHVVSRPWSGNGSGPDTRLVTLTLVNRRTLHGRADSVDCFFQVGFQIRAASGVSCFVPYPEREPSEADDDELSMQLLYRHRKIFAVGHGCSADWDDPVDGRVSRLRTETVPVFEMKPVLPTKIEGLELSMLDLAAREPGKRSQLCTTLALHYERWIDGQEQAVTQLRLVEPLKEAANRHLEQCRRCLARIRRGIELLSEHADAAHAFRLMNRAMLMQQIHYARSSQSPRNWVEQDKALVLERPYEKPDYEDRSRRWRPFQLAFILMNLEGIIRPDSADRGIVDLIWFPTGGGKTEAYLGVAAFAMLLRRLRNDDDKGTVVIMRYTLRLLTTQQYQRAASLICACEYLRRTAHHELGHEAFSIGLWVGGDVTPNREADAISALNAMLSSNGPNKFVILVCPWCGAAMGPVRTRGTTRCKGYRQLSRPARVRFVCDDTDCDFHSGEGLPLEVIDEQIYQEPPSLLVGTVDKFAMLPFLPDARNLFAIGAPWLPPDLIIQDELHLIAGPLGSMVGHYETVIDELCIDAKKERPKGAKIVASTATIARADDQVHRLYGREACLFPPQGLQAGDSFFAAEDARALGRMYVGVMATALPSHITAQIRVIASLLQAPLQMPARDEAVDPYWTIVGYFNSLRELGQAATLTRADIREYLNAMWDRLGLRRPAEGSGEPDLRRFVHRDIELTSRVQSGDIPALMQELFLTMKRDSDVRPVDVCLATNMIQVGLDIPRLGLMTVIGQPKTTSEYIQASSRIGRAEGKPGLVVTNYNAAKPRDRSHYEQFRAFHESIYRHVEPTSITPFAVPVRERALHALIVTLCRFWGEEELKATPRIPPDSNLRKKVKDAILVRVHRCAPEEAAATGEMIDEFFARWALSPPSRYGGFGPLLEEMPLLFPAGSQKHPAWADWPTPTATSMRNVDSDCEAALLLGGYRTAGEDVAGGSRDGAL